MSQQAERRVGAVIANKWRVDGLLGAGSMAAVYAATHRNGARAALKILHPTLCTDASVCERFLGEGYLTNSVKHPGIVRVLDDGVTDDGCVFLVMDLLDGTTLETLRQERGGQIGVPEIVDIADKLMDALRAVHAAEIIHRDLKLQNVFVCTDGSVKILDFGVARVLDQGARSKLSVFGLILGTPSFMSPEQALGAREKVDHRTDIWSLGATFFTAITGQTVHLGPNVQARLLAAASVKARSIAIVKPDLPASLAAAIDVALRFKKEDRWQTVEAFQRAFRDACAQLGLGKRQSLPPPERNLEDDPTYVDQGERSLAMRANHEERRASVPRKSVGLEEPDDADEKRATVRMRAAAPASDDGVAAAPAFAAAPATPIGGVPILPIPPTSPIGRDAVKAPKLDREPGETKSTLPGIGVWLAALALIAAVIGGIAFFAVRGAHDPRPTSAVSPSPRAAATPAPSAVQPAAKLIAPQGKDDPATGGGGNGGVSIPVRTAHVGPASAGRAVPDPSPADTRTDARQRSARPTPAPARSAASPSDPFGTPD